jgi:hypothetical protein
LATNAKKRLKKAVCAGALYKKKAAAGKHGETYDVSSKKGSTAFMMFITCLP